MLRDDSELPFCELQFQTFDRMVANGIRAMIDVKNTLRGVIGFSIL